MTAERSPPEPALAPSQLARGWLYGAIGVVGFSLTLPMTRIALTGLDPVFVGLGRALVAAALALAVLAYTRQRPPPVRDWPRFALVALGIVVGFPLLSALAIQDMPLVQAAVISGLMPLTTAVGGVLRGREQPSPQFWFWACAGSVLVVGFAVYAGAGWPGAAGWLLFGAVASAGMGYTEGALLARSYGALQVICWALVVTLPFLLPLLALLIWRELPALRVAPLDAWLGFAYVGVVSMFLGFVAWYRGLALGGIARVGQVQLLQPFLTIVASVLLFGERADAVSWLCAVAVCLCVIAGARSRVVPVAVVAAV